MKINNGWFILHTLKEDEVEYFSASFSIVHETKNFGIIQGNNSKGYFVFEKPNVNFFLSQCRDKQQIKWIAALNRELVLFDENQNNKQNRRYFLSNIILLREYDGDKLDKNKISQFLL